jgi:hypothetical protein
MEYKPYTAPYKNQLFGYEFRFFSEKSVWKNYLKQVEDFNLGISFRNNLEMIFRTRYWETRGFDGKTFIKDRYAGNLSVFFHDYASRMGFGCYENDVIFLYIELCSGNSEAWALTQFQVVRMARPFFNLRDYIKGRRQKKPQWIIDLYNEVSAKLFEEFNLIY